MTALNKYLTVPLPALALGLALATLASPSFARDPQSMSSARETALRECNGSAGRYGMGTWLHHQLHTYRSCMAQHGEPE
jgi:hypothetical protein